MWFPGVFRPPFITFFEYNFGEKNFTPPFITFFTRNFTPVGKSLHEQRSHRSHLFPPLIIWPGPHQHQLPQMGTHVNSLYTCLTSRLRGRERPDPKIEVRPDGRTSFLWVRPDAGPDRTGSSGRTYRRTVTGPITEPRPTIC